jgi:protein phosphatase PTC1
VCSDQEAVDLVRKVQNPQAASKILVDHALARFSTDNLSVMIVRFDSKKLQDNTTSNIGVESEASQEKGISEVEMIVAEARRHSGAVREGIVEDENEAEDLREQVIKEQDEEQEFGPEFTPEGQAEADKIMAEKKASKGSEEMTTPRKEDSGS